MNKSMGVILGLSVVSLIAIGGMFTSLVGNNGSGERQFVQTFTGETKVVFEPGPYWKGGGSSEPYDNVLTLNNTGTDGKCEYERNDGFKVQYADGGWGVICMQAQFPLPLDSKTMTAMHKRFYSEAGITANLNKPTFTSLFTNTAKLYTSTEAYSTKSAEIQNDIQFQVLNGGYQTEIEQRDVETGVDDKGKVIIQKKAFAIIKTKNGEPLTVTNPFAEWGMPSNIQVQITGFDFEEKTITQISLRRDATNRAETAQDNAKAAYWETKQAEADGEKARVTEEYAQKKLAEVEIQQAEKAKRLAIIDAEKQEESARLLEKAAVARTAQAQQDAIAAKYQGQAIEIMAKANAYANDALLQAELPKLKLQNDLDIATEYSNAIAKMQVPSQLTILGSSDGKGSANPMETLLQLGVLDKLTAQRKATTNK